eukprot:CAMPEP_0170339698 /NCGR_PEP_ID=MMETSP0116_2-20130129/70917_1 /TAXON_ID=400756 /ORGANISM="Durinskia baltica, Strain CSIRO CS-38" /LENGTH=87 /DNA_ID=CAMNT_0010593137 /DNA_START=99 /DNA_END=359 /DNA_ORIENTATION=+
MSANSAASRLLDMQASAIRVKLAALTSEARRPWQQPAQTAAACAWDIIGAASSKASRNSSSPRPLRAAEPRCRLKISAVSPLCLFTT